MSQHAPACVVPSAACPARFLSLILGYFEFLKMIGRTCSASRTTANSERHNSILPPSEEGDDRAGHEEQAKKQKAAGEMLRCKLRRQDIRTPTGEGRASGGTEGSKKRHRQDSAAAAARNLVKQPRQSKGRGKSDARREARRAAGDVGASEACEPSRGGNGAPSDAEEHEHHGYQGSEHGGSTSGAPPRFP